MKPVLPALLIAFAVTAPVPAGETEWQEVMEDVSIRLVATDVVTQAGTVWAALEIDMPEAMKTYWRVPGESGIPPRLDFSGSTGIGGHAIAWPYPTRGETASYLDHAYYGRTVLPIEIEVTGDAPVIALNALLGICSDICVPVSVDFVLPIDHEDPDHANRLRIEQARAEVPIMWDGDELIGDIRFSADEAVLVADIAAGGFPAHTAIADIAGRPLLFGPPEADPDGRTLRFPLLGKAQADLAEGEAVHVTFMGEDGPYEIVRPLGL